MGRLQLKNNQTKARARKVRSKVSGTAELPRMAVAVSNKCISVQLIDDVKGETLVSASKRSTKETMTEVAVSVGEEVAEAAKKAKITQVVLDRRGKKYHGRIKALCEAANKKGLKV